MTKKSNSVLTPGAKALFPVSPESGTSTQANFKVSKADLIGILSTGLIESLEAELEVAQEAYNKADVKHSQRLEAVREKEYKAAVKLNAFELLKPEDITVRVHERTRWIRNNYVECVEVTVSSERDNRNIVVPGAIDKDLVAIGGDSREYDYYVKLPATAKKLKEALREARNTVDEIRGRMAKASNPKFMTAQLNMNLLASVPDGGKMAEGLGKLVENLKTSVFAKPKHAQLSAQDE